MVKGNYGGVLLVTEILKDPKNNIASGVVFPAGYTRSLVFVRCDLPVDLPSQDGVDVKMFFALREQLFLVFIEAL